MNMKMNDERFPEQPPTASQTGLHNGVPTATMQEEFTLFMSLALDGLLGEADEQRFQAYLAAYPAFARQWQSWQRLDQQLNAAPHAEPTLGFAQRFTARLDQRTQRQRRWRTTLYSVGGIVLWVGLLAGSLAMGAYVLNLQASAMGNTVHYIAWLANFVTRWWATLEGAFYVSLAAPQARYVGLVYVMAAAVMLTAWIQFLRHSTHFAQSSL